MLVLVTRARDRAARTAEKLARRGHQALVSSVLDMQATGAVWPAGVVDAVLATSAPAFELLAIAPDWPLPEARRLLPLFLVGESTAQAARARGFEGPALVAADAQDLAAQLLAYRNPPQRTLYLAGHDRKSELETRLGTAGLALDLLEVYEARAAPYLEEEAAAALGSGALDAVLHYSRRSAEIFLALAEAEGLALEPVLHVAISEDAAQPLRAAGLPHIAVAAEPKEQAVLDVLDIAALLPPSLGQPAP